ncbi:MAG: hypothetical protein IJ769_07090 [Clostridia bacterium]|nr:hypothetical protein [Clostridia bacterium]
MIHTRHSWRRLAARMGALALLCVLILPCLALSTRAESGETATSLAIDFSVDPSVMVAPGDVTMTFVIKNRTDRPVRNIYLSSADGQLSEPIGQIGPGETQTLLRPHTVTADELNAGVITYTVSHDPMIAGEEKISYPLSATIAQGEALPGVDFTRQFSSDYVPRGGLVTITYKIANTGNVTLSALRIRDTLGDFTGRLERLDVGESKTFISRVTLNDDAESAPVLEYTVPSGEILSRALESLPIRIASSALDLSFSIGQTVFEDGTADAILILTNAGNVDYTGITVLDDVYGGVIADALTLPSGGAPVEVSHTYSPRGEGEYRWRITGFSGAGETLDLRTETLTLSSAPETETVDIDLRVAARTPRINRAGQVTFDFAIANNGSVMARDALLYEVNRGEIRRLAVLPTGEPSLCSASYEVRGDAQFVFCLNYTDANGHQRTVSSAPIDIVIAADGATPERVGRAGMDLEGESVKMGGNTSTFIVLLIIAGAALTVMITILAVASIRARRDKLKRIAAEKQRVKAELGKTGAIPTVKAPKKRVKK